jgi:hypothetical protein
VSKIPRWTWIWALLLIVAMLLGSWLYRRPVPLAAALPTEKSVPHMAPSLAQALTPDKPTPAAATRTLEICGLGKVQLDGDDPSAAGLYLGEYTKPIRGRWLKALLNSGDSRARATGLFLKRMLPESGKPQPIEDQDRDALVQLAVGAKDPAIYALAVNACGTYFDPSPADSCRQITLDGWAKLDADNAVPWLLVAGKARARNDATAAAAALAQAAKAHQDNAYNYSLYSFAEAELPKDVTPLERWYFAVTLVGIEAAAASMEYNSAAKQCSAEVMQDTNIRRQCSALAELMVGKGTTLIDLAIGARIGARAGWSKARIAGLDEERDALFQSITQATPNENEDLWTCDGVNRGNTYMDQRSRLGELGAARELLDRSGETVAELAQKQRDHMENFLRDAQRRTAVPSAPTP